MVEKTTRNFICRKCNSRFGKEIDSELASSLNFLANIFKIKRQRGNSPPVKVEAVGHGDVYIDHSGQMTAASGKVNIIDEPQGKKISFTTGNLDNAKKILRGLRKKFPKLDVNEALSQVEFTKTEGPTLISNQSVFNPASILKSATKSALSFMSLHNIDRKYFYRSINFLLSNETFP